jgi:hypothetical protein
MPADLDGLTLAGAPSNSPQTPSRDSPPDAPPQHHHELLQGTEAASLRAKLSGGDLATGEMDACINLCTVTDGASKDASLALCKGPIIRNTSASWADIE